MDYPFTLFEIRVNKAGEGEGRMAVATMISFDKKKNTMELENYSSEPVRLQNLKIKVGELTFFVAGTRCSAGAPFLACARSPCDAVTCGPRARPRPTCSSARTHRHAG